MPVMKPVTTCLARRSSWAIRAMVSGCRKRLGSSWFFLATVFLLKSITIYAERRRGEWEIDPFTPLPPFLPFGRLRREDLLEALVLGQFAFLGRRVTQEALDHLVGRDAFGR